MLPSDARPIAPPPPSVRARELALAALAYLAATLAFLRPIWRLGASRITPDPGDPLFVLYLLKWGVRQARLGFPSFWNAPFFYPLRGVTALSDHLLGPDLVATAWTALGGSVVGAYNLLLAASFVLCGWSTFYVLRKSGARALPALFGGAVFAFSPFRWDQLSHLQILLAGLVPLILWSWDRLLAAPSRQRAAGFLALYAIHLSGGTYLAYMIHAPLAVLLANRLAMPGEGGRGTLVTRRALAVLLPTAALCALLSTAVFRPYWEIARALHLARTANEARVFGASMVSLVTPSQQNLYAGLFPRALLRPENTLFAGFLATGLATWALAGLLRRHRTRPLVPLSPVRRRILAGLLVVALAGYLLGEYATWSVTPLFRSLALPVHGHTKAAVLFAAGLAAWAVLRRRWGGNWPLAGREIDPWERGLLLSGLACLLLANPLVYNALMGVVPGLAGMRVPARFYPFVSLPIAHLAARGLAELLELLERRERFRGPGAPRRRAALGLLLAGGLLLDLAPRALPWIPIAQGAELPPVYAWIAGQPDVRALVELPFGGDVSEIAVLYRGTRHWKPLVNGYSGYEPETHRALREHCFPVPDRRALELLRGWQVTHVLVHLPALDRHWERRALREWEAEGHAVTVYDEAGDRVYRLLPSDPPGAGAAGLR